MAEIKIEKEKTIWPWVLLGLILLGLLLYFFVFRDNEPEVVGANVVENVQPVQEEPSRAAMQENVGVTESAVADYIAYVDGKEAMGLDHVYSSTALIHLANAVQAKASMINYDVQADIDQVKQLAEKIQKDPLEVTHANSIRNAAEILAKSLMNMQQAKYPNLASEGQSIMSVAQAIDPDVQTLNQKQEVKAFFDQAAQVLQKMS